MNGKVFKVYALDRIQQHGLWSRTLTFQFLEVACMIVLILAVQAHPQYRVMSVGKRFFGLFPGSKKSPKSAASPSSRVPSRSSSWTPAAYEGVQAGDENDEYFEYTGALWKRLGTPSTSATVGAKSAVTMAIASCRCTGPSRELFPMSR